MPNREDVQVRLKNLGYYGGKIDGDLGPASCAAIMAALDDLKPRAAAETPSVLSPRPIGEAPLVPEEWLQRGTFERVILHWTVGGNEPSEFDREHYHILLSGKGKVVRGLCDISANSSTAPSGRKASHTLNCNTGSIGVSLAGMVGAEEHKTVGPEPITKVQWDEAAKVVAELCRRYRVPVTPRNVLSHAEVQQNLGIKQRGKWDVAILPWDRAFDTAKECGDLFRKQVQEHLAKLGV